MMRDYEEVLAMLTDLDHEVDRLKEEFEQQIENHDREAYNKTGDKISLLCGEIQALQWVLKFRDKFNNGYNRL